MSKLTVGESAGMYEIGGKEYPIMGECKVVDEEGKPTGDTIPIVDVPMMSDYDWQVGCLVSRLRHPEYYRNEEDVENTIQKIKEYLAEHNMDYEKDIQKAIEKEEQREKQKI